jgi:hypothetical protein
MARRTISDPFTFRSQQPQGARVEIGFFTGKNLEVNKLSYLE